MWVVYNVETTKILHRCSLKKDAKFYRDNYKNWPFKSVEIDKVDITRLEEWQMWKLLQGKR